MAPVVLLTEQWDEHPNIATSKTGQPDVTKTFLGQETQRK